MKRQSCFVTIKPYPALQNGTLDVLYKGRLTAFPENKLYVFYGYGNGTIWDNVGQQEMQKTPSGYTAAIKISGNDVIKMCFHDNKGHWDNNRGSNWCFTIDKKGRKPS